VEPTRDLGRIELWEESLERSLARRGKLKRSSPELYRLRPERDLSSVDIFEESWAYSRARREAAAKRPGVPVPVVGLGGVSALALLSATVLPSIFGGRARGGSQQVAFAASGRRLQSGGFSGASQPRPGRPVSPRPYHPAPQRVTPTTATTQAVAQVTPAAPATPASSQRTQRVVAKHAASKSSQPTVHRAAAKPTHHQATVAAPITPAHKPAAVRHSTAPKPPPARKAKPAPVHHTSKPPASKPHTSKPTAHRAPAPKPRTHSKPPVHHSPPPKPSSGYVNPLAHASVTPERIDQGVDYAGTGTLTSIGRARVNYVGITGTGWPGAFIEYRLLDGPDAGRYVYYAEGVRPAGGISVGRIVQAGQAVANLIPGWSTGIEIGWGAGIGTETLAAKLGEHTYPTAAGENFSALIASLGGPPGRG
jgi:hypothetical protein